ncbi:MAG: helix-turn-helix domain-containing protein [Alphaproteobacteria bacterium]|nr:helix-turn-helix domain-containing protein [Alphaproteobacteria bacterium]MBV8409564.1 helix-turn-helix domain-containing protein [Alphaproteobacteria bacterium]
MSVDRKIPFSLFTTESVVARQQFELWHDSISVVFDAERLPDHGIKHGFAASVRAYHLGALFVSQVDFEGVRFVRDRKKAASDGVDHYLVHLYATGGLVGTAEDRDRVLRPGDVQILDLSQPNLTRAERSGTIAMMVPRDTLRQALPDGDLHGLVLRGDSGAGALLADYMRSLMGRAPAITTADAPFVAHATTEMIAACFRTTAETMARARTAIEAATLERIQRYVEANLASPDLLPEVLCAQFALSRSQLYRLFEPLGGVAGYIQEKRLARAYSEIADLRQSHRRIYDIAFDLGFTSEAHFSRIFRRTFGVSPSDVRGRRAAAAIEPSVAKATAIADDGYEAWVRNLRRVL